MVKLSEGSEWSECNGRSFLAFALRFRRVGGVSRGGVEAEATGAFLARQLLHRLLSSHFQTTALQLLLPPCTI